MRNTRGALSALGRGWCGGDSFGRGCGSSRRPRQRQLRAALPRRPAAVCQDRSGGHAHLSRERSRRLTGGSRATRQMAGVRSWEVAGMHCQDPVQLLHRSHIAWRTRRSHPYRPRGSPRCRRGVRGSYLWRPADDARSAPCARCRKYRNGCQRPNRWLILICYVHSRRSWAPARLPSSAPIPVFAEPRRTRQNPSYVQA